MGFSDYSDELLHALERIWKIVHVPSRDHQKGAHAYTHFMADFDEIRAICKPYTYAERVKRYARDQ